MPFDESDSWLDKKLREAPTPPGLVARLKGIAEFTDLELDHELKAVVAPGRLLDRLRQIPADIHIDAAIVDAAMPAALMDQLLDIPRLERRRTRPNLRRLVMAASLFFLACIVYYGGAAYMVARLWHDTRTLPSESLVFVSPMPDAAVTSDTFSPAPIEFVPNVSSTNESPLASPPLAEYLSRPLLPGPYLKSQRQLSDVFLADNVWLLRWAPLAAPIQREIPPLVLDQAPEPVAEGLPSPRINGFDRLFLLKHGVNPVVVPAAHPMLSQVSVPLVTKTQSYDLARQAVSANRLPNPASVRVEQFLAALNWRWTPPKPGQVNLQIAAGTSPFEGSGAALVQIAVQAGESPRRPAEGVQWVVAVDVSRSMGFADRLRRVRQGLVRLFDSLSENDRISLVVYNDTAATLFEGSSRSPRKSFLAAVDAMRSSGGADLSAGLRHALEVSLRNQGLTEKRQRVVVITDGDPQLSNDARPKIVSILQELQEYGLTLEFLTACEKGAADFPELTQLAKAAGGSETKCFTADDLYWALRNVVAAHSLYVAKQVRLNVRFDPNQVKAYRLIGHEPRGGADNWRSGAEEISLRAGEAVQGLFEVWLKPSGKDVIGEATLSYSEAEISQSAAQALKTVRQPITRAQFASSWSGMAPSLQASSIVAEAAEVLRGSYFAPPQGDLRSVLEAARQVQTVVAENPDFRAFVSWIESAEKLRKR